MNATARRPRFGPLIAGFAAGVIIAVVVGIMATINLTYGAPWSQTYTLTAAVSDADAMSVGSDVRIGGRLAGQVVSVTAQGNHADVVFHVDNADWPLPSDTTASVRLATLLGQKYIQLNPGHSGQPMANNATIGLQATKPVVDFDQILNTFDKPTRDALTSLIRTGAAAVQGQEGTLQQLFPNLSDLSVHSQVPTQELVTRDPELNSILVDFGVTATQLNQSRDALAGVIDHLNSVNATLAAQQGAALKSYIQGTDALNLTTHQVLGNGYASRLGAGLKQLGTFTSELNTMVATLIPQTQSFMTAPSPATGDSKVTSDAARELIYEIGSATSQSNFVGAAGNYFLRQQASGVDPCGLVPVHCGLPANSQQSGTGANGSILPWLPSLPTPPNLPLPSPQPLPSAPPAPTPPPSNCILGIICTKAANETLTLGYSGIDSGWFPMRYR